MAVPGDVQAAFDALPAGAAGALAPEALNVGSSLIPEVTSFLPNALGSLVPEIGSLGDLAAGPLAPLLFLGTTLLGGLLGGGSSTSNANANAQSQSNANASVSQGQSQSQQQGIQGSTNNAGLAALGGAYTPAQMPFVTGPPPNVPTMAVPQVPMNPYL